MCKSCQVCQGTFAALPPPHPWKSISSDIFSLSDKSSFLIVDRFSRYPLVAEFKTPPTSHAGVEASKHYCAIFGRPDTIISDNGTQYNRAAYQEFIPEWNIDHITNSPNYPRSNGLAEGHVRHNIVRMNKPTRVTGISMFYS